MWAYTFTLDMAMKNLEVDTAISLQELFLASKCKFFSKWKQFYLNNDHKVMTRDVWEFFYGIVTITKGNISNYKDDGSAPPVFDKFIETLT